MTYDTITNVTSSWLGQSLSIKSGELLVINGECLKGYVLMFISSGVPKEIQTSTKKQPRIQID